MSKIIDLNSDVGESFGAYKIGLDKEVLKYVSSANIACGWHAGDPIVMRDTVGAAFKNSVGIGAHPGFFDVMGFGRRNMTVSPDEIKQYTIYQLGALYGFVKSAGAKMQHVKPHGAMYNMAAKDSKLAQAIIEGIWEVDRDLIVLGSSGSEMIKAAKEKGLKAANEIFADRAYNSDGTLVARSLPGAMILDTNIAISRVIRMVTEGKVTAISGEDVDIKADSICVHGDNPEATQFVKLIREELFKAKVEIKPLSQFIT
ncbi:5-oxoprolinase subunit PxpA [Clostridium estertheticum]|uniref:5-oxoprolinase subunit A n=1 Tax=Clostridium estertheticum TaxID=238834 RepID=A0AA47EJK3_9CLOT|nr:5-oxoprolinase subunit PxpA [Clostridium estertheticum]MBU3153810.1 5-oxoprolinase subunit PxpA [Clostridium estertheticum]MBU3198561.1 5-oxoprolinase subunit PxpA [Clostridium estertheticum]WAG61407.1 5-oxoprolinase subunit PxpA [Clostridium estertheticum]WAG64540.1 5-oxoprolinase subunit PxpA [Clostridium estertheticum]